MDIGKKTGFRWEPFIAQTAQIAIPVALQNLLTTTGSMVDTIMISSLGEAHVGAVGLCAQFSSLMFSCYWGFVGGGMLFFSQYWGAGDEKGICRSYGLTQICMMTVAVIFFLLALCFPSVVMGVYTDKEEIRLIGQEYLRIIAFAYPFQVFSMAMSSLLRSTEKVRIPLYGSICGVATNIVLNYVFIYRLNMGVRGAACATAISAAVNTAVILLLARGQKYPFLFRIKDHFRFVRGSVGIYFKKCFPIICNELLIGVGNMVINIVLGRQPEEAIAALAVFRTFEGLVIGFFAGFSNAASVLVGKCVGEGKPETAYERAKRIVLLCGGVIGMIGLLLILLRSPLLTMMNLSGRGDEGGTAFYYGSWLLVIYGIAGVIRMCNWVQNDTYRSAGDTRFGTVLEISFMYALVLPAVCLSGLKFKLPFLAVFGFCYVDEPIRLFLMLRHLISGRWIKPVTPEGIAAMDDFYIRLETKKQPGGLPEKDRDI